MQSSIRRSSLTAAVVVVGLIAVIATTADAVGFVPTTLEDLARSSDLVLIGRVERCDVLPEGPHGLPGLHTRVRLGVTEALAGARTNAETLWVHGGRLGRRVRRVSGQAKFEVGEELVVFLFRDPQGALWPSGMARGKWHVRQMDGRRWVTPSVPLDDSEGSPLASGVSSPNLPTLLLAELRNRVRRARTQREVAR